MRADMEIVYERCCGLDIHKDNIVACVLVSGKKKEIKAFSTMTGDLLELCRWLKAKEVQMVALESTGSYWKPVFNLLEVEEILATSVNARHIKAIPGRKKGVKDAEWIARLLRYGLLKASFVQPRNDRKTKELVRYRTRIIKERAMEYNHIDKVLLGANINLSSLASGLDTKPVMYMIRSITNGIYEPKTLAQAARGSMRTKIAELERAITGLIQPSQQMLLLCSMLDHLLDYVEFLTQQIDELDIEIARRIENKQDAVKALDKITGVG